MRGCSILTALLFCVINNKAAENPSTNNVRKNETSIVPNNPTGVVIQATRPPPSQGLRLPCSCLEGQCGCCTGMILERLKQKACMNFTYEPEDFAVTATMSMNERVLYKNTISGKNPPPMCIRVPRFRFIKFCVEFSNIYFAKQNIHMCVDAEATWEDFTLVEWSFDCLRLGASGVAVLGPEDGGGLPLSSIDQVAQVDEDYDDNARNAPKIYGPIRIHSHDQDIPVKIKKINNDVIFLRKRGKV